MKRLFAVGLMILGFVGVCSARNVTMDGPMTDANAALGQAYTNKFNLNLDDHDINTVVAQVVFSSGTYAAKSFTDGTASSATITVVTAGSLSTATASGSFTAVSTIVAVGYASTATVSIAGTQAGMTVRITGPPPANESFTFGANVATGDKSTNSAVNLMNAINLSSNTALMTASLNSSSTTLTVACINAGTACNSYTFLSSSTTAISTSAFTGGINPVSVTIGGYVYRAVADFAVGTSTAAMMNNLATLVNASSNTTQVTSTATLACIGASSCGIMYATMTVTGAAGNNTNLASSNYLAISTSGLFMTGGQDNAQVCINGTCLVANTNWYPKASAAATADSLYAAINTSFTIVVATDTGSSGVIYTTATTVGSAGNYTLFTSTYYPLKIAGAAPTIFTSSATGAYTGGSASSFTLSGQSITVPAHGWPLGLKVSISSASTATSTLFYSTATSGGTSTALVNGTSVYVIPVNTNSVKLSLTSTGAVAGLAITFVSTQAKTTTDTYTLQVATCSGGSYAYGWFESNDGTNFWQVPGIATTTIAGGDSFTNPSTFTFVDFGTIDAKWLQLNVAPPSPTAGTSAGAMAIQANIHGERR